MDKKEKLNDILMALLGNKALVEGWWTSKNKHFGFDTPQEVWDRGQQKEVIVYVLAQTNGDYS